MTMTTFKTFFAAVMLAASVSACMQDTQAPPTFTLWQIVDHYTSSGQSVSSRSDISVLEKGLNRVACELVQTKLETKEREASELLYSMYQKLAASGGRVDLPNVMEIPRFVCVAAGQQPKTEGPVNEVEGA
jgi:hypothetical protein